MTSEREIRRLETVYRDYERRDLADRRWGERNRGNRAIHAERRRVMEDVLGAHGLLPLGSRDVLEVGCGTGHVLASLVELGAARAHLAGVDLLANRIEQARRDFPEIAFTVANAEALAFGDASFDLVLLSIVFTSILDASMRANVARESARVLRPGGALLWYDFRYDNPSNPNVRGMRLGEIRRLFPGFAMDVRTLTFVPQLARRLGMLTPVLYPLLAAVPPLRTYYMILMEKPAS